MSADEQAEHALQLANLEGQLRIAGDIAQEAVRQCERMALHKHRLREALIAVVFAMAPTPLRRDARRVLAETEDE